MKSAFSKVSPPSCAIKQGLQGHAGQILRRCSKRAWKLEQLYGDGDFEADIVDENLLSVLRLYRGVDGDGETPQQDACPRPPLRQSSWALAEAVRFLRDLAGELGA